MSQFPPTPPPVPPAPPPASPGTGGVRRDVRFMPLLAGPAGSSALRRALSVLVLLAIDVTSVFLGLYAALALKLVIQGDPVNSGAIWTVEQKGLPLAALTLVLVFAKNGLYAPREVRGSAARILSGVTLATIIVAVLILAAGWEVRTFYIFYSSWFLISLCVLALRASYSSVTALVLERLHFERRVLLIGAPALVETVSESLEHAGEEHSGVAYRVVGRYEMAEGLGSEEGGSEPARALRAALDPELVDEVIIAGVTSPGSETAVLDLLDVCRRRGLAVRLAPTTVELLSHSLRAVPAPGLPLFELPPAGALGVYFFAKRAFDLVMGIAAPARARPDHRVSALAVKLHDRGPLAAPQPPGRRRGDGLHLPQAPHDARRRGGRAGRPRGRNEADGALFKIRDDPRVTAGRAGAPAVLAGRAAAAGQRPAGRDVAGRPASAARCATTRASTTCSASATWCCRA